MTLPILPPFYKMKIAEKDGTMAPEAALYNDEQSQTLVKAIDLINMQSTTSIDNTGTVAYDGLVPPRKTTAEITVLAANAQIGTMWFDTTIAKLKVLTAPGVIETITSS